LSFQKEDPSLDLSEVDLEAVLDLIVDDDVEATPLYRVQELRGRNARRKATALKRSSS